jgi:hypothetical protein
LDLGLHWIRRRQRSLTRAALAIFFAAWLQAAIVPCVAAHGSVEAQSPHDSSSVHGHAAGTAHAGHGADGAAQHCIYCPPGDHASDSGSGSCDSHGGCAYLHDPQVDGRTAGALFAALPASYVVPAPGAQVLARCVLPPSSHRAPRIRLSVSYCRFIE